MDETSSLVGVLLVWLFIGILVTLLGAQDMFEAWTEDCLVGTEHQRCAEGQGRVMFGVGLAMTMLVVIVSLVTAVRSRTSRPRRGGGDRLDGPTSDNG